LRISTVSFSVSVAIAAVAILAGRRVADAPKAQSRIVTRPVVVAVRDIAEGSAIERTSVAMAQWPVGTIPVFAYRNADLVVGRVARVNIFKGEVLVPGRFVAESR
jgi:pilus assembly protein CpaB